MGKTPLGNQLLIYLGITFSFAFILIFVRLLTPEISVSKISEDSVLFKPLTNGFSISKRPYYAVLGM